ncbi:MAG: portal protein [Akkermansia sp.]
MNADEILRSYHALCAVRSPWEGWWRTLRRYVLPDRQEAEEGAAPGSRRLADTTAVEACQKLASAHLSYLTPGHELWFKWGSPRHDAGDEAEAWYNTCSDIANRELSLSNFYTALHECFLDRVALGTGSLYCGTTRSGSLLFRHIPCGHFVCGENDEGTVDTYMREFSFTPHQAASQFGTRSLGPRAQAMLRNPVTQHEPGLRFLHIVSPRTSRNTRRNNTRNKPFRSVYFSLDDNCTVEESGYNEMPYMVTRFLRWGDGPYGLPPARLVYPDILQAQFLNRILDMLGEVAAFPRILELANQVGEVDLRAGGRTLISPESASLGFPREWATQGRYDVGMDRLRQKQDAIRRAFFLPMLEIWSENKQHMTAAEVYARENERVMLFSPSFTLFACDFRPLMERIFALLFRCGAFPRPPASAQQTDAEGRASVAMPQVVYQGRIAMVMRRIRSEGIERTLQRLQNMAGLNPELVDHVDLDRTFRLAARMDGAPEEVLRSTSSLRRLRRKREEQAAQAAAAAQAAQTANPAAPLT